MLLGAQCLGCVLIKVSLTLLFISIHVSLLLLIKRVFDDRNADSRVLALMIYVLWSGWIIENAALPPYELPPLLILLYSLGEVTLGMYLVRKENSEFNASSQRSKALALGVYLLGMLPMNLVRQLDTIWLILQTLVYSSYAHALFYFATPGKTLLSVFAFSFWVLTSDIRVGVPIALFYLAYTSKQEEGRGEGDEENPPAKVEMKVALREIAQAVAPPSLGVQKLDVSGFQPKE